MKRDVAAMKDLTLSENQNSGQDTASERGYVLSCGGTLPENPAPERLRYHRLLRLPRNTGMFVRLKSLKLRSKYLRWCKVAMEELISPLSIIISEKFWHLRSSLTTWPIRSLHLTPFH